MTIAAATAADAAALGAAHVAAWRETYPGILSEAVLSEHDAAARAAMWARIIAAGTTVLLARDAEGRVVGFVSAGPQREPEVVDYPGEIYSIYLLRAGQRRGLGRALMAGAARSLLARGLTSANLWVLDGNEAAIAFYTALGGRVVKRRTLPEWEASEAAFAWDDLTALAG
ncbi:MAG: GNAT family N-acetyltransferase [Acetobacteraceae bacterium]|nr:GNAT family N-acetyltransferase [Acetobacteraceae bacterium]